jgi:hypothetical protein
LEALTSDEIRDDAGSWCLSEVDDGNEASGRENSSEVGSHVPPNILITAHDIYAPAMTDDLHYHHGILQVTSKQPHIKLIDDISRFKYCIILGTHTCVSTLDRVYNKLREMEVSRVHVYLS